MDKNDPIIGVTSLITNEKGEILLMQRPKNDYAFPYHWGLIGGLVERGETLKDALKREVMEEVGIDVDIIDFTGRYYDTPGRHPTKTAISLTFRTCIISGVPYAKQQTECADVRWFAPEQIRNMDLAFDHKQMLEDENLI